MDSDEEKRRDRFRTERNDHSRSNRDYRDAPSNKRKREDDYGSSKRESTVSIKSRSKDDLSAPVIQTFKQWVVDQEDQITVEVAGTGYSTYKIGERKRHVEQFFLEHKVEEWFREKYHPEDSKNYKIKTENFLKERFNAWKKLSENGCMKNLVIDLEHQEKLAKILDASIMLMEGCNLEESISFINDGNTGKPRVLLGADGNPPNNLKNDEELEEGAIDDASSKDENYSNKQADTEDGEVMDTKRPKSFKSLFIKYLNPMISKADLITVCKKMPGFVRVACEIIPGDKKFSRRAWITFDDSIKSIRDHSWTINNSRVKECEITSVAHKDAELKDRIRTVPGLSNHSAIAFRDLKLACDVCEVKDKILSDYDEKRNNENKNDDDDDDSDDENNSKYKFWEEAVNPLYLEAQKFIQEYEEMYQERLNELLDPLTWSNSGSNPEDMLEIDAIDDIFNVLDPLLVYLRVVHSVDFYAQANHSSYEDEHPNRCGPCHVRGAIPSRGVSMKNAREFTIKFQEKISENLIKKKDGILLDIEQGNLLGRKDENSEVEKFIEDNTQQIDADKYLCPLSGKKFRGKDYVKKHILNKFADKVESVKKEVSYFNNYVMDSNKIGPPEPRTIIKNQNYNNRESNNRSNTSYRHREESSHNSYNNRSNYNERFNSRTKYEPGYIPREQRGQMPTNQQNGYHGNNSAGATYNSKDNDQIRRVSGGRGMVDYRDLDAPENMDMFG